MVRFQYRNRLNYERDKKPETSTSDPEDQEGRKLRSSSRGDQTKNAEETSPESMMVTRKRSLRSVEAADKDDVAKNEEEDLPKPREPVGERPMPENRRRKRGRKSTPCKAVLTPAQAFPEVKLSGETGKRWTEMRGRLEIENDDEMAIYLMDFHERKSNQGSNGNSERLLPLGEQDQDEDVTNKDFSPDNANARLVDGISIRSTKMGGGSSPPTTPNSFKSARLQDVCRPYDCGGGSDPESPSDFPTMVSENWCCNCDTNHHDQQEDCPFRKPRHVITDSVIDFSTKDAHKNRNENLVEAAVAKSYNNAIDLSKSFAQLSLPHPLKIQETKDDANVHQFIVMARIDVQSFTQFGPLQGEHILERDISEDFDMKDIWQVSCVEGNRKYLNTANPEKSNWLRYVRPADSKDQCNLLAVHKHDELFFVTCKDVAKDDEILYWIDDPALIWSKKRAAKTNCGGCNLKFAHPLYYRLHCVIFHDPHFSLTIRKYHCKICGVAVLGKENIVRHAMKEHDGRGAYQCQFCEKYFLRLNYLEMHKSYGCSSNPGRTRPLCELCGKKFCQPQKLRVHMKRMHGDSSESLEDFQCPICNKILGTRHAANRHRKEVHSDIPNHRHSENHFLPPRVQCQKCGRTFKNKSNLKIHMLTHSGVKPFSCKIEGCKTGFTTKQCLQFHYRKTHCLTDENMPKIEREIPYTLSAYSGGLAKDDDDGPSTCSKTNIHDMNNPAKNVREEPDVYEFNEESDDDNDRAPRQPVKPDPGKASMLVAAALCAAEHDLNPRSSTPQHEESPEPTNDDTVGQEGTEDVYDSTPPDKSEQCQQLMEGREATLIPHPPESMAAEAVDCRMPDDSDFAPERSGNAVDVIPIPNPNDEEDKDDQGPLPPFGSSLEQMQQLDNSFANHAYQSGAENLSRLGGHPPSYQKDYSSFPNSTNFLSSMAASSAELPCRSSSGNPYNNAMINEHLLGVNTCFSSSSSVMSSPATVKSNHSNEDTRDLLQSHMFRSSSYPLPGRASSGGGLFSHSPIESMYNHEVKRGTPPSSYTDYSPAMYPAISRFSGSHHLAAAAASSQIMDSAAAAAAAAAAHSNSATSSYGRLTHHLPSGTSSPYNVYHQYF